MGIWGPGTGGKISVRAGDGTDAADWDIPAVGGAYRKCGGRIGKRALAGISAVMGAEKLWQVDDLWGRRLRHQWRGGEPGLGLWGGGVAEPGDEESAGWRGGVSSDVDAGWGTGGHGVQPGGGV